jgi:hypothetical protein
LTLEGAPRNIRATPPSEAANDIQEVAMLLTRIILPAAALVAGGAIALSVAIAQNTPAAPAPYIATITDPIGPLPDPGHIPITLPKDIKWPGCGTGPCRSEQVTLWGDPTKPGSYGLLIKWYPGAFSRPHFHTGDRWIYVVSGTWWVSSSNVYDTRLTHPVPAGSSLLDVPNTVHFDGNRAGAKEPAIILLSGMGPVVTTQVDETGKPLPGRGAAAAPAAPAGRGN